MVHTKIAYLAVADGYWEVWTARADGSQAQQLTRSKHDKSRLSWFPDGKTLLASRNDGVVVAIDERGAERRIPLQQSPVVDAVISPDGTQLAFSFSTAIDGNDLWIAHIDGSGARKINRMARLQHEPTWSVDGGSLYFLSGEGGQSHDIWKLSLQGGSAEQLTVGTLYNFDVAVAGNGDLAFSSNRSRNYEIYWQRAGGGAVPLTDDPALDAQPTFSPDGATLVFVSTREGTSNLWSVDLGTKAVKQITRHRDGARAPVWYQGARP